MSTTTELLFKKISAEHDTVKYHSKITIVGAGAVGLAAAYSILNQGITSELVLVEMFADKLKGEIMDLCHGAAFFKRCILKAGTEMSASEGSDLVIITAGARQKEGESRLSLVDRNLVIFKSLIPDIVKYSPNCTICVVSNPVDIMTHIAHRLSGFPAGRVFGSGTALDSSRFRSLVAERLKVDARSVHGCIIGEHGDSSVACWSNLNVGGIRLRDINPSLGHRDGSDPEEWADIHKQVVHSAYEIIKAKGYTNWAIGLTCAAIAEAVIRNEHRVLPLSVPVKNHYGITEDVCLSLPAVLGLDGVTNMITPHLDEDEKKAFCHSASTIAEVQNKLSW